MPEAGTADLNKTVGSFLLAGHGLDVRAVSAKPYQSHKFDAQIDECFKLLRSKCVNLRKCRTACFAIDAFSSFRAPSVRKCITVAPCAARLTHAQGVFVHQLSETL